MLLFFLTLLSLIAGGFSVVTEANANEETITSTPDYANRTVTTTSSKGWTRTTSLNNLGLPTGSTLSGTGIPTTDLDPVWRADGSLASVGLTIGGEKHRRPVGVLDRSEATSPAGVSSREAAANQSHTAAFNPDGTLSSLTAPGRGNILEEHTILNGLATLKIDGVKMESKLDGTQVTTSGADIIGKSDTLTAGGGGYQQTIHPLALGADTKTDFNAAGAPTAKTYAAGEENGDISGESYDYEDELLASITLPRGGSIALGYSPDGAKDLTRVSYPGMSSGTLTVAGFAHKLDYDRAGRVNGITDYDDTGTHVVGARSLAFAKGRLDSELWTAGPLKGYQLINTYDGGRKTGFILKRDGAIIHSSGRTFTGDTGQSGEPATLTSGDLTVVLNRNNARQITGFQWGSGSNPVTQSWTRGTGGRIEAAESINVTGAHSFTYLIDPAHPEESFDGNRRLKCDTADGIWTYGYTNGQLTSAVHRDAQDEILLGSFSYEFDGIGRRKNHVESENFADILNRTLDWENSQNKILRIRTAAGATVHIEIGTWTADLTNFDGDDTRPISSPGANGGWVPWRVLATLLGQGEGAGDPAVNPFASPDAKSEQHGAVWVPPINEAFTYDAAGNRESSAQWDYGWDAKNQLVRARTKNCTGATPAAKGYDLTFDYDAEGRRFRKHVIEYRNGTRVAEKEITFIWDGWDLIYERHQLPSGLTTLERKYLWGPDIANGAAGGAGGLLLIRESKGNPTQGIYPLYSQTQDIYPLYDGTGHVIALTNSSADLLASYAYGPFGELIHAAGPAAQANPWRYATKYLDEETGLYYFGRRYLDPVTGQWMSRELLGESESLNLYSYCHNDPVNRVDVLGLREQKIVDTNGSTRFRRGADGGWEVHLLDEEIGFWDGFFGTLDRTITGGKYYPVTDPMARFHVLGYAEFNETGGVPSEGSRLIQQTFQIAEEQYHLSTHARIGQAAMGIYGAALAAPGLVLLAPEAGAGAYVYGGHAVRAAWANPWVAGGAKAAFLGLAGGTGYGLATDSSFRSDFVAMEMSSPLPGEGTAMGINGLGMMAMDARAGMGGLLSAGRRWLTPANWEFAPLGQFNMGAPFPRYVGGSNTTRFGITRTNPADWRATRNLWDALGYEKLLSPANRARISAGTPPLVDDAWLAVHPEDAGLVNEQIRMHHVLGLPLTIPLPVTRHLNAHMPGGFRYNPGGSGSQLPFYPLPPTE